MESENLAEMVKKNEGETEAPRFSESDLDLPSEEEVEDVAEETETFDFKTVPLNEWFEQNHEKFGNINHVKASIRGVDPSKTLIMSVLVDPTNLNPDENAERKVCVFEKADESQVLNLPGSSMDIFNNGFKVIYQLVSTPTLFLKCYGVKTGLIVVFCNNINDQLIPYAITKLKKTDEGINQVNKDITDVIPKLNENVDLEALGIMYKQISKYNDQFTTKQDVVDWFLKRQTEITDVNHLLQIDSILINILQ